MDTLLAIDMTKGNGYLLQGSSKLVQVILV